MKMNSGHPYMDMATVHPPAMGIYEFPSIDELIFNKVYETS